MVLIHSKNPVNHYSGSDKKIFLKTEDEALYLASKKNEHDRLASLEWAMENGHERGLETGYIGRITILLSLLGQTETPAAELHGKLPFDYQKLVNQLKNKLNQ